LSNDFQAPTGAPPLEDLALRALGLVPSNATYADVRVVRRRHEGIHVQNEAVDQVLYEESLGLGLRVLLGGQWGFAATPFVEDRAAVEDTVRRAVEQARAAAGLGPGVGLAPVPVVKARYATPLERDPFSTVGVAEKVDLLLASASGMRRGGGSAVRSAEASMDFFQDHKLFASSEGSVVEQLITESGGGIMATAADDQDVQRRSFPQSVPRAIRGQRGDFATAGYEHVAGLGLVEHAERVGSEATGLLTSAVYPAGKTTLIVGGTQMALVIHETAGHPAELDRVLGSEASLSGGSFMEPNQRGTFQFGADIVSIDADATLRGGMGSFAYDDEGVAAQCTPIVEHGRCVGYMTSRESAARLGLPASGAARADGWQRVPLVRMTNLSLRPGTTSLEEMIGTTEEGVLVDMNRSLSIDDRRLSFRFGSEIGWEIRRGRITRLLKNPTFSGTTPSFWASCDALGNGSTFRLYGLPSCNKGEPLQAAHVGHGTVPGRFRGVMVGVD
jgi:TldD protein